jgi:hypothetical protein
LNCRWRIFGRHNNDDESDLSAPQKTLAVHCRFTATGITLADGESARKGNRYAHGGMMGY